MELEFSWFIRETYYTVGRKIRVDEPDFKSVEELKKIIGLFDADILKAVKEFIDCYQSYYDVSKEVNLAIENNNLNSDIKNKYWNIKKPMELARSHLINILNNIDT